MRGLMIGIGNIALKGHLPGLLSDENLKSELEIVAGVDLSADNRAKFKEILPSARVYASLPELFAVEKERFDFIDVCTTPNTHLDLIQRAFEANGPCHVICEKPVVVNNKEAAELRRIFADIPYVFLPCHQYRYTPQWRIISETIEEGLIGRPHLMQFNVFRTQADVGNNNFKPNWRIKKALSGGGILVDHGSHIFYLAAALLGAPRQFTCRISNLFHSYEEVEDSAWVHAEYEHGVTEIMLTWAAKHRAMYYKILGDKGEIITNDLEVLIKVGDETIVRSFDSGLSQKKSHSEWFVHLFKEFLSKVQKEDYSNNGLDEALLSLKSITASYRSAKEGRTVEFA